MKWWVVLVVAGICLGVGYFLRPDPPVLPPPPVKADTVYYPIAVYEAKQELIFTQGPRVWLSDTVQVVYERLVTDTLSLGWNLPPMWCVEQLRAPTEPGDTLDVSLVMVRADSITGIHQTYRIDRLWANGYLRALEVIGDELRVDYEPFKSRSGNSFWRWMERGAFFAGGVGICKL